MCHFQPLSSRMPCFGKESMRKGSCFWAKPMLLIRAIKKVKESVFMENRVLDNKDKQNQSIKQFIKHQLVANDAQVIFILFYAKNCEHTKKNIFFGLYILLKYMHFLS